jgi:branched-subunit amino acid ABC-type transport system permease component
MAAFPFLQLLLNSLVIGSIYALVAVGFSLIYQTNRFMHFAHGAVVAFGAYIAYLLFAIAGVPFSVACVLTLLAASALGWLMHRLVYLPLQRRKSSMVILLIASFGLLIILENAILLLFGSDVKDIGLLGTSRGVEVWGATITPLQAVIVLVAAACMAGTYLFMGRTRLGRNLRAVADNSGLADIMGIDSRKYQALSFIIGSALAGVAGILIGLEQHVTTAMGTELMIKGFSGSVIGGITSVPASILGSYIVGMAENFGVWFLPSGFKDAITFVLLFLFLLFRPQGLFGVDRGGRR